MSTPLDRRHGGGAPTLLCDLDGTLVDSAPDLLRALNSLLELEGRAPIDLPVLKRMVGDGVTKLVERGWTATGGAATGSDLEGLVDRFLTLYETNLVRDTVAFPRVGSVLSSLKESGWKLAVCTNKPERPSRQILETLGLSHLFEAVAGGDSYPVKKPDPGHLLATMAELQTTKERCVMLGDSGNDVRAAQAAGVPVVLVTFGYCRESLSSLGADALVDDFADLPAVLAGLTD